LSAWIGYREEWKYASLLDLPFVNSWQASNVWVATIEGLLHSSHFHSHLGAGGVAALRSPLIPYSRCYNCRRILQQMLQPDRDWASFDFKVLDGITPSG
jgi:hypothetical protein